MHRLDRLLDALKQRHLRAYRLGLGVEPDDAQKAKVQDNLEDALEEMMQERARRLLARNLKVPLTAPVQETEESE